MNITRTNFPHLKDTIINCLQKSQYVAFDFEMTGITAHPLLKNSNFDSMQDRYWKARENVRKFLPIQMGICGFEITTTNELIAYPFNFYLFPFSTDDIDRRFLCQTTAIQFLTQYNFDFNKLFYDGIWYLSYEEEQNFQKKLGISSIKKDMFFDNLKTPEADVFFSINQESIEKLISETSSNESTYSLNKIEISIKYIKMRSIKYFEKQLEKLYPFVFFNVTFDSEVIHERTKMIVERVSEEKFKQIQSEKDKRKRLVYDGNYDVSPKGFREIIDTLIDLKTPLITHNGFLDILHVYDKFIGTLPLEYVEFKNRWIEKFPSVYDTKYMLNNSNLLYNKVKNVTDLSSAYEVLLDINSRDHNFKIDKNFTEYQLKKMSEVNNSHEAGFDALMTGYVFLNSLFILGYNIQNISKPEKIQNNLLFFQNRLPLGGVKVPFNMNLTEDIYAENLNKVFHLESNTKNLNDTHFTEYFSKSYGQINLFLIYGDRIEYFFTFQEQENAQKFSNDILKCNSQLSIDINGEKVHVQTYAKYQENLRNKVYNEINVASMPEVFESLKSQDGMSDYYFQV